MFTPSKIQHYYNLHSFSCQYYHSKTSDVQNDVASSMLRLTRFNLNHHQRRRQATINHRPNSVLQIIKAVSLASPMADVPEKSENPPPTMTAKAAVEGGKEVKAALQPPAPPEKPEAGDCCGSGCVRCVWDVYYDELEAYDLLLKEFNSKNNS